ncbi:MAG TPA: DUF1223 domain-containing protein [Thermoanaerobaculia bacterium]|jgi:hypothetical protein|nr:DUF1223 domain-containing protein [Thermoanaerobaculia bacterium]
MNPMLRFSFLALVLIALAPRGGSEAAEKATAPADRMAIVELFTSQGCSSCPPADRLLSKLAGDPRYQGKVIPLSFHVDYWNYIGWTDPYSSSRWSDRQRVYAGKVFRSNRIYTPQVVVNGRSECVGNSEGQVAERIAGALAAEPAGRVSLAVDPPTPDGHLKVKLGAKLARAAGSANLDLWVAVYESGLSTEVKSGENASRTLRNDRVVRRLEKAFTLPAAAGSEKSGEIVLGLDKRWKVENVGVAAFLQDPATLAIHGAAARELGR